MSRKRVTEWLMALVVGSLAVVGGVYFLDQKEEPPAPSSMPMSAAAPVAVPAGKPWTLSEGVTQEANRGFTTTTQDKQTGKLAGKQGAGNWPRFNGAQRNNMSTETGLLKSWPAGGPKLLWSAKGIGGGFGGLSVVDGVVYLMSSKGSSDVIATLDAGTGEKLWCSPFAAISNPSYGPGPRSTPTIDGDLVYGMGANGDLVALHRHDGKIVWQKNLLTDYKANNITWGICESVLIDGEHLICTPGGAEATMVALDKRTGKEIWKGLTPQKDSAGYASATIAEVGGIRQYVQFTALGTIGIAAKDGRFLWRENSAANGTANCSSPLVSGDKVFSASNYGVGGALVKLMGEGEKINASLVYHTKEMKCHHGDMVIHEGLLFGSNEEIFVCLELATGKRKWHSRAPGKGSVTYAEGRLYIRNEAGPLTLVLAQGDKYEEVGKFDQPERSSSNAWTHPVIAAGRLFLRDQDLLLCYDITAH